MSSNQVFDGINGPDNSTKEDQHLELMRLKSKKINNNLAKFVSQLFETSQNIIIIQRQNSIYVSSLVYLVGVGSSQVTHFL